MNPERRWFQPPHQRLADNHRRVQHSLNKIITALEAVEVEPADDQG